jgi:tetratricopeptide (TPR) repeat protein
MRSLTPRRHIVTAIMVALMAGGVIAQQNWYDLYDQAIVHITRGEWEQAETKLRQAQKDGPAAGRSVLRYGMFRRPFFPDFYLGVVYLNTNRPSEALRQFALARAQKINPQDREFQTIAAYENEARTNEKLLADAAAMPTTPKKPVVTEPPPETLKAENKPAPPPSPPPVETKIAENAPSPAAIERDRQRASAERDAMQSFFAGDYRKTVATLDKAERDLATRLSPRGYFYRACAMAAQALRSSSVDAKLLADARKQYAEAIRDSQTALPDRKYVSPRILEKLGS